MARVTVFTAEEVYVGLIDEGQHFATCTECIIVGKKLDPKVIQLEWNFEIFWNNKRVGIRRVTPLQGRGVGFTRAPLDALMVQYDETSDGELSFDTDDCIGKQCFVTVKHEMYENTPRNKIDGFIALESPDSDPDSAAEAANGMAEPEEEAGQQVG